MKSINTRKVGLLAHLRGPHARLYAVADKMKDIFPHMTPAAKVKFLADSPDLVKGIKRAKLAIRRLQTAVEVFDGLS